MRPLLLHGDQNGAQSGEYTTRTARARRSHRCGEQDARLSSAPSDARAIAAGLLRGGPCVDACARDRSDRPVEPNDPLAASWSPRGALMAAHDLSHNQDWPIEMLADFLALAAELGYDSWRDDDDLAMLIEKFDRWAAAAAEAEVDALMRGEIATDSRGTGGDDHLTPPPQWKRHCFCNEAGDCRWLDRCNSMAAVGQRSRG